MQTRRKDVVIDSDVYNECDDLWALSYLLGSEEEVNIKGIYIAPFLNYRANTVDESIDKSYEACIKLLKLAGKEKYKSLVFKGARRFMGKDMQAVPSPAVTHLIKEASEHTREDPLYVIEIAAITNVASALMLAPQIAKKIEVVWLGCHAYSWIDQNEFNLQGDIVASNIILKSGVKLTLLPCMGVVSEFLSTEPEMKYWLGGKNSLSDWLIEETKFFKSHSKREDSPWSVVFWDVTAVAYVLDDNGKFMRVKKEKRPFLNDERNFAFDETKTVDYVYSIDRDVLMEDLFKKISKL